MCICIMICHCGNAVIALFGLLMTKCMGNMHEVCVRSVYDDDIRKGYVYVVSMMMTICKSYVYVVYVVSMMMT